MVNHPFKVGDLQEIPAGTDDVMTPAPSAGETTADLDENATIDDDDLSSAYYVAIGVTPDDEANTLTAAAEPDDQGLQEKEKADAIVKLKANGIIDDSSGANITVIRKDYLAVTAIEFSNTDTSKSITLDITPKYNLWATTEELNGKKYLMMRFSLHLHNR